MKRDASRKSWFTARRVGRRIRSRAQLERDRQPLRGLAVLVHEQRERAHAVGELGHREDDLLDVAGVTLQPKYGTAWSAWPERKRSGRSMLGPSEPMSTPAAASWRRRFGKRITE